MTRSGEAETSTAGAPVSEKIYCVCHYDPFLGKLERTWKGPSEFW
jgi:hypothetical protein